MQAQEHTRNVVVAVVRKDGELEGDRNPVRIGTEYPGQARFQLWFVDTPELKLGLEPQVAPWVEAGAAQIRTG